MTQHWDDTAMAARKTKCVRERNLWSVDIFIQTEFHFCLLRLHWTDIDFWKIELKWSNVSEIECFLE